MNKYDMNEFLECCISSCTPSEDGKLDPCSIKKLKIGIKKFSIKHKKDIMELFTFSENNGKYVSVYACDLVSIMDEYETYHNDMIQFIQSLQDITNETSNGKKRSNGRFFPVCGYSETKTAF